MFIFIIRTLINNPAGCSLNYSSVCVSRPTIWDSQRVQAVRGILSLHAVQVDLRYHVDQPDPKDQRDRGDPEDKTKTKILDLGLNQL